VFEKLVYIFILISLFIGVLPNAILNTRYSVNIPFYLFDITIFSAFLISIFLKKYRSNTIDIFICLTWFYLFLVSLLNLKLLFLPSSVFYLARFFVISLSYPFFLYIFKTYRNFAVKTLNLFLLVSFIFYLIIFVIFPNVTLVGFDPHVKRLYGMFIDPNFYSVFACLVFFYCLLNRQLSPIFKSLLISLSLLSLFLTFSRLGLLVFLATSIVLFLKNKSSYIVSILVGFLILVLTNVSYLYRILFVGGNLDSFVFKIISFVEGVYLINAQNIPVGFNNITIYRYFLMSNINNVTSFFDFTPFSILLSGGIIFAAIISFLILSLTKLNSSSKLLIFLFIISGFVMNTIFNPVLFLLVIMLVVSQIDMEKAG